MEIWRERGEPGGRQTGEIWTGCGGPGWGSLVGAKRSEQRSWPERKHWPERRAAGQKEAREEEEEEQRKRRSCGRGGRWSRGSRGCDTEEEEQSLGGGDAEGMKRVRWQTLKKEMGGNQ